MKHLRRYPIKPLDLKPDQSYPLLLEVLEERLDDHQHEIQRLTLNIRQLINHNLKVQNGTPKKSQTE